MMMQPFYGDFLEVLIVTFLIVFHKEYHSGKVICRP